MRVKMVGLGKCGSRTVLDFHAVVHGQKPVTPSFRTRGKYGTVGELMGSTRRKLRALTSAVTRNRNYLPDPVEYMVADVDETNDVLRIFQQDAESGENTEFEGKIMRLHETLAHGCGNFHILGQAVMKKYLENSKHYDDVVGKIGTQSESAEMFFICFSLGGGTGGGSAIELAERLHREITRPGRNHQTLILGVAVLPELFTIKKLSDDGTEEEDPRTDPSRLGYSAGRFLLQQHARVHGFDGTLLISNNIIPSDYLTQHGIGLEDFHGKMNEFLANIIRELATQHTKFLPEIDSADVRDLKTLLGGEGVLAGYTQKKLEGKKSQPERSLDDLAGMLVEAISPVRQTLRTKDDFDQHLRGLSVDVDLDQDFLERFVGSRVDRRSLLNDPVTLPREFRQAKSVAIFYGIPRDDVFLPGERELLHEFLQRFFPNALREVYSYHHLRDTHVVTMLVSGLFSKETLWDMYQYFKHSWVKSEIRNSGFENDMDSLIVGDKPITKKDLADLVSTDQETFDRDLWPNVDQVFEEAAVHLKVPNTYFQSSLMDLEKVAIGLEDFRLLGKRGQTGVRAPRIP